MKISNDCYFIADDDPVHDPVVGRKRGSVSDDDTLYQRRSKLDDIPDDFEARMSNFKPVERRQSEREAQMPDGFTVSIAYNKSGYQVIPKGDV